MLCIRTHKIGAMKNVNLWLFGMIPLAYPDMFMTFPWRTEKRYQNTYSYGYSIGLPRISVGFYNTDLRIRWSSHEMMNVQHWANTMYIIPFIPTSLRVLNTLLLNANKTWHSLADIWNVIKHMFKTSINRLGNGNVHLRIVMRAVLGLLLTRRV